jgi:predicted nucleic acid-binding protein
LRRAGGSALNNSSIFVINKNAKIVFPSQAFVDTNVVLDIYLNRRHKGDWLKFIGQATQQGTEFVYTLHSLREVRNVLNYQIHSKKAAELNINDTHNTKAWKVLENDSKFNFSKDVATQTEKVESILKRAGFKFKSVENNLEIFDLENEYAKKYDLGPGDTAIAATMEKLEINSICTNDAGFFKTDDFNVYSPTPNAFRVSQSRNNVFKNFKPIK